MVSKTTVVCTAAYNINASTHLECDKFIDQSVAKLAIYYNNNKCILAMWNRANSATNV